MIPTTIHHVWPGQDPFRAEFHRFRTSWVVHHPDWSLQFWRTTLGEQASDEVRALLADPAYTVVVKSDVARFELLRIHGGIYVDTDVECLRPLDDLRANGFFCGREDERMLCPSVLGSVPGHPFAALVVREALGRIREAGVEHANAHPNEVSGPVLLTELARGRQDLRVFGRGHFYPVGWWETDRLKEPTPNAYAKHWWNGTTSARGWTRAPTFAAAERPPAAWEGK